MTFIHADSFDHYSTAQISSKGYAINSSPSIVASGRTGTNALEFNGSGDSITRILPVAAEHATLVVGFAVNFSSFPPSSSSFLTLLSDAGVTTHISLTVSVAGGLAVRRGTTAGTVLASGGALTLGSWFYVELKVLLSDTVGTVDLRINGASVASGTGLDTKNSGTKTVFDGYFLGQSSNTAHMIDDHYVLNGAGSAPTNTFLGDVRVRALIPNGNGNSSQLLGSDANSTDNYQLVDESPADTADYVGSATDNQKDTYNLAALTELTGTVFAVQNVAHVLKTDAGARSVALVTRSNGADYDSADIAVGTSAAFVENVREVDPDTSAAWTIAAVNAMEVGVKVRP